MAPWSRWAKARGAEQCYTDGMRVLVVDDQAHVRQALELLFSLRGIEVCSAAGPAEAIARVEQGDIGVVVQDMNFTSAITSGDEGAALFRQLRALRPGLPVILMTAWASVERAVELVKEGAADYVAKPWDNEALLRTVRTHLEAERLRPRMANPELPAGLICESARMRSCVKLATKVAGADVPVLITGPNGAGKEKIAELVQARSQRSDNPFVRVNVGALPDELLEAELFGAEAGAFTGAKKRQGRFEAAHGGTLFLDELGNLSLAGQAKLLRVLQTGELQRLGSNETRQVDVRIIAATNANLTDAIAAGRFREDLYYRLAVIELRLPPLEQRGDDILPLAYAFIDAFRDPSAPTPKLSAGAQRAMLAHRWPGNVRELQNAVRRALLIAESDLIEASDLQLPAASRSNTPAPRPQPQHTQASASAPPMASEDDAERRHIEAVLREHDSVISKAAQHLGLSRQALYRRMRRLGIEVHRGIQRNENQ